MCAGVDVDYDFAKTEKDDVNGYCDLKMRLDGADFARFHAESSLPSSFSWSSLSLQKSAFLGKVRHYLGCAQRTHTHPDPLYGHFSKKLHSVVKLVKFLKMRAGCYYDDLPCGASEDCLLKVELEKSPFLLCSSQVFSNRRYKI